MARTINKDRRDYYCPECAESVNTEYVARIDPLPDGTLQDVRRCEDKHEFEERGYDDVSGPDAKDADVHNLR